MKVPMASSVARGVLILALVWISSVTGQMLSIFRCPTASATESCNGLREEIFLVGNCTTEACQQCMMECEVFTPAGNRCPSADCTTGLCSAYSSLDRLMSLSICTETYGQAYCSFCELCLLPSPTVTSGSGSGMIDDICESSYLILFCRLLPQNATACTSQFGSVVCNYCQSSKQLCGQLPSDNLTSTQVFTLCQYHELVCPLYSFESDCSLLSPDDATLCSYCNYTTRNDVCLNCSSDTGLVCRLLVSDINDCRARYDSAVCMDCANNYSYCGSIDQRGNITSPQTQTICNSATASICSSVLSVQREDCPAQYSPYNCTYCQGTQDICNYPVLSSGDGAPVSCNSPKVEECALDFLYFPCYFLNDIAYCLNCSDTLSICSNDAFNFLIPPICSTTKLISLCSAVIASEAIPFAECSMYFSQYICTICPFTQNNCTTPGNVSVGLDLLCSPDAARICNSDLLLPNGSCSSRNVLEPNCDFCRAQRMICFNNETGSGQMATNCFDGLGLLCRLISSNGSEQICNTSPNLCQSCSPYFSGCEPLAANELTPTNLITLCSDYESICPISDSLCSNSSLMFQCEFCNVVEPFCATNISGNGTGVSSGDGGMLVCDSFDLLFCRLIATNTTDCYLRYDGTLCTNCTGVVSFCGPLTPDSITQSQVDTLCTQQYQSYCGIINSNLCPDYYGSSLCSFCFATEEICQSNQTLQICNDSAIVESCVEIYLYYPCYSLGDAGFCDSCRNIIQTCPNITYDPNIVPDSICESTDYRAFCNQVIQQDCVQLYGMELCSYCELVNTTCPSVSPDEILTSFTQFCSNNATRCTQLLSSVSPDECNSTYTSRDCAFCSLLAVYCSDSSGSGYGFDMPCTEEFIYFCNTVTNQPSCYQSFSADTCESCERYLQRCPRIRNSNVLDFCTSVTSISTCAPYPFGIGCRPYFQTIEPDLLIVCDYCSFYGFHCQDIICNETYFVQPCYNIITFGATPQFNFSGSFNVSDDAEQCLPCSVVYAMCLALPLGGSASGNGSGSGFRPTRIESGSGSGTISNSGDRPIIGSGSSASGSGGLEAGSGSGSAGIGSGIESGSGNIGAGSGIGSGSGIVQVGSGSGDRGAGSGSSGDGMSVEGTGSGIDAGSTVNESASGEGGSVFGGSGSAIDSGSGDIISYSIVPSASSTTISSTSSIGTTSSTIASSISTTSTTTSSTVSSINAGSSVTPTPTESPTLPTSNTISFDALTPDEQSNAVTLVFTGLTVEMFIERAEDFIQTITSLVNNVLQNSRKRQQSVSSNGVLIVTDTIRLLSNGHMEVAFLVRNTNGDIVMGGTVAQAVASDEASLAQAVGATGIARITEGVPDYLTTATPGLSDGAVAGIVIGVLLILIILLLVGALIAFFAAKRGKTRAKYIFAQDIEHKISLRKPHMDQSDKGRAESLPLHDLPSAEKKSVVLTKQELKKDDHTIKNEFVEERTITNESADEHEVTNKTVGERLQSTDEHVSQVQQEEEAASSEQQEPLESERPTTTKDKDQQQEMESSESEEDKGTGGKKLEKQDALDTDEERYVVYEL